MLFYWFGLLPLRPHIVWDFPVWSFSLSCPLSFSYSTTWSYNLFVLVLFWTSYFVPFPFCRLLFCPLILCPVCFLNVSLLSPSQVCRFSFRPSYNVKNAYTFDADDAWLQALCFFNFIIFFIISIIFVLQPTSYYWRS